MNHMLGEDSDRYILEGNTPGRGGGHTAAILACK
jgi:hypothetical protein